MSITPFRRVESREIYGADVSGLQDAVNRCEHVLSLGTATVTGHTMTAVSDQASPSLHRRIYEATIRGWLESPAPVIRRGGAIVPIGEYTLFAAQGAVVFHAQQAAGTVMTADFTHITDASALTGHPAATTAHGSAGAVVGMDRSITIDPDPTPVGNSGVWRDILGWLANRIRVITGATNWWNAPATTLAAAHTHHVAGAPVHGSAVAATASTIMQRDAAGNSQLANTLRLVSARTPASAIAPGEVGEICWDADFVYVCVAADTWRRATLVAW